VSKYTGTLYPSFPVLLLFYSSVLALPPSSIFPIHDRPLHLSSSPLPPAFYCSFIQTLASTFHTRPFSFRLLSSRLVLPLLLSLFISLYTALHSTQSTHSPSNISRTINLNGIHFPSLLASVPERPKPGPRPQYPDALKEGPSPRLFSELYCLIIQCTHENHGSDSYPRAFVVDASSRSTAARLPTLTLHNVERRSFTSRHLHVSPTRERLPLFQRSTILPSETYVHSSVPVLSINPSYVVDPVCRRGE
jgi:hypothetical protein